MNEKYDLSINTKLMSFHGIIGRRDYAVNTVYATMLNLFVTIPFTMWYMSNIGELSDMFNMPNLFVSMPALLKIWVLLGTALTCTLIISNVVRRLNDVCGKVNQMLNNFISAFWVIVAFSAYLFPMIISLFLSPILCILGLVLLFTPGKITSKMPYDVTKQFNWGAFFGTWIWGLFNKSYIPLWMLILWLTPLGLYFQLLCGLKGNEWAYKNKKCTDVDAFNSSQKTQATIWTVLAVVVVPILYFFLIFMLFFGIAFSAAITDIKNDTSKPQSSIDRVENMLDKFTMLYFESYEITPEENKFYVLPSDWKSYSFSTKKDIIDTAANMAASKRRQQDKLEGKKYKYYSKLNELPRTKIYSSTTKELLGEFVVANGAKKLTDLSFKEYMVAIMKSYKFYKPTKKQNH